MKLYYYQADDNSLSPEWSRNIRRILSNTDFDKVDILPAGKDIVSIFDGWNGVNDINSLYQNFFLNRGLTSIPRLLVTSTNQIKYKKYCEKLVGHAEWGCYLGGAISFDYSPCDMKLTNQIHETLHLFGVADCYGANLLPNTSCNRKSCLMRYGVNSKILCNHAVSQLTS